MNTNVVPKKPRGTLILIVSILLFVLQDILVAVFSLFCGEDSGLAPLAVVYGLAGILGLLFMLPRGGGSYIKPTLRGSGALWKVCGWLLLVDGGLIAFEFVERATAGENLAPVPGWELRIALLAIICLGIGFSEEGMFRGLINNGLQARMGTSFPGAVGAAVISSIVFGFAHVTLEDFAEPIMAAQAVLKIIQTGIFGFAMVAVMMESESIWPIALFHAFDDFILMVPENGLYDVSLTTDYVASGDEAVATLIYYIFIIILYLPSGIAAYKLMKRMEYPKRGAFWHWEPPADVTLPSAPLTVLADGAAQPSATPEYPAVEQPVQPSAGTPVPPVGVPVPPQGLASSQPQQARDIPNLPEV